jgi:hypothetical protein
MVCVGVRRGVSSSGWNPALSLAKAPDERSASGCVGADPTPLRRSFRGVGGTSRGSRSPSRTARRRRRTARETRARPAAPLENHSGRASCSGNDLRRELDATELPQCALRAYFASPPDPWAGLWQLVYPAARLPIPPTERLRAFPRPLRSVHQHPREDARFGSGNRRSNGTHSKQKTQRNWSNVLDDDQPTPKEYQHE